MVCIVCGCVFFFFKQKTAYEMRISDWSSDVCSSDLVIVVVNYLWRPLFPQLVAALAPTGLLLYETFMQGHERVGRPTNPDYLLAPDELFERLKGSCDILAFEQGWQETPNPAMRQRICARKRCTGELSRSRRDRPTPAAPVCPPPPRRAGASC